MAPLAYDGSQHGARRRGAAAQCAASGRGQPSRSDEGAGRRRGAPSSVRCSSRCVSCPACSYRAKRRALQETPPTAHTCAAVANRRGPRLIATVIHGDFEALADVPGAAKIVNASCGEWTGATQARAVGDVADRGRDVQKANACATAAAAPRARGRRPCHKAGRQPRAHACQGSLRDAHPAECPRRGGGRRHAVESGRVEPAPCAPRIRTGRTFSRTSGHRARLLRALSGRRSESS